MQGGIKKSRKMSIFAAKNQIGWFHWYHILVLKLSVFIICCSWSFLKELIISSFDQNIVVLRRFGIGYFGFGCFRVEQFQ